MRLFPFKLSVSVLLLLVLFSAAGCQKDQGEAEKKVIAYDPSFQKTIDNRNSLRRELVTQRAAFSRKSQQIDSQIDALKEQKAQAKKEYIASVDKIKRQIHPAKRQLQRDLMELERKYRRKSAEVKDLEKDINEISDLIEKKDELALTQEEIQTWNERLTNLNQKKDELSAERKKIQTEIEITKLKDRVLKL
jgi:chromosome segregation ATPase